MITDQEEEQLQRLEAREQDFYAGAMFLGLIRAENYLQSCRLGSVEPSAEALADLVVAVFEDLNARVMRRDDA